jgi:hypothetical protein
MMKKILTISGLALAVAAFGSVAGQSQERPAVERGAGQEASWRGEHRDGPPHFRHGRRGDERSGRAGRHGGRHDRGPHGGRDIVRQFQDFDLDSDGAITQAEVDQFRQNQINQFDANKDGMLSLDEYQALWLDQMRERMVDAFQEHDDDGDGQVTAEEFKERFERLVERFDRNDDDRLSEEDGRRNRRSERGQAPAPEQDATPQAAPAPAPQQ